MWVWCVWGWMCGCVGRMGVCGWVGVCENVDKDVQKTTFLVKDLFNYWHCLKKIFKQTTLG